MPKGVPAPDVCEDVEVLYARYLKRDVQQEVRDFLVEYIAVMQHIYLHSRPIMLIFLVI